MKINIKMVIVILIVASGVAYVVIRNNGEKNAPAAGAPGSEKSSGVSVTGLNLEKREITVVDGSVEKTVKINPATRIQKIILQKNADGSAEKQASDEVNISDLHKGDLVVIDSSSEKDNVLDGVQTITFSVDGNVEEYFKKKQEAETAVSVVYYVKGQVVSIDTQNKKIVYKAYIFNTLSTAATESAFAENIPVYRMDNEQRGRIVHAKEGATLGDIQPGQTVLVGLQSQAGQGEKSAPQEFIIISGK